MVETCIVCLGDVRSIVATDSASPTEPPEAAGADAGDEGVHKSLLRDTTLTTKRYTTSSYHEPIEHACGATLAACSYIYHTREACSHNFQPLDGLKTFAE
jgi:hypothetical protein